MSEDENSPKSGTRKSRRSYTIFIGNLPYSFTEKDVRNIFKNIKTLGHIYLPRDKNDHIRGFGFVSFGTENDAVKAMKLNDGTVHCNKRIRCRWGNETNIENPEDSKEFFDSDDESRNQSRQKTKKRRRDYYSDYSDSDDRSLKDKKDSKKSELNIDQLLKVAKVDNESQFVDKIMSNSNLSQLIFQKMVSPVMFPNPLQMNPGAFPYQPQMVAQPQPMMQQPVMPIPGMPAQMQNGMPAYSPNSIPPMQNPNPIPPMQNPNSIPPMQNPNQIQTTNQMLIPPIPDNQSSIYPIQ